MNKETERPAPTGYGYCGALPPLRASSPGPAPRLTHSPGAADIKVGCDGAYDQNPPNDPGWVSFAILSVPLPSRACSLLAARCSLRHGALRSSRLTPRAAPQDACDIAEADQTQESLENWDKENITALALKHGLAQDFLDKTFKGLFPKRKIARELLPMLKPEVVRTLCEGKDGKSPDKTCDELGEELLIAGRKEDVAEVRRLLGLGASASHQNDRGNNALLACAGDTNNIELAKLLIENGADVNAGMDDPNDLDYGQWLPLHRSSTNGNLEMTQMLLSHGADLEHGAGKEWRTPLMLTGKRGHPKVATALIEAGADTEYHSGNGMTPLMEASSAARGSEQHTDTVKAMIEGGADVHKENYINGNQAIHYSAVTASLESAKALVNGGAKIDAENHDGYTPMDYANKHSWNFDMRVWFREQGAECTMGDDCRDDSKGRPKPASSTSQKIDL